MLRAAGARARKEKKRADAASAVGSCAFQSSVLCNFQIVQEEVLRAAGARARKEKERADAASAVDSSARAALASSRNQEVKRLRQEQVCVCVL